jgi:hypothetical protein
MKYSPYGLPILNGKKVVKESLVWTWKKTGKYGRERVKTIRRTYK